MRQWNPSQGEMKAYRAGPVFGSVRRESRHPKKVSGILGRGRNRISGGFAEHPCWNPKGDRAHFER